MMSDLERLRRQVEENEEKMAEQALDVEAAADESDVEAARAAGA